MENIYNDDFLAESLKRTFENEEYFNVPKGIIRYDYDAMHGWWVRVTRDNAQFKKFFNDHRYISSQESLRDAVKYRHELLSAFPMTIKYSVGRSLSQDSEKRINHVEYTKNNKTYIAWRARWYNKDHKIKTKCFSVRQYGEEQAKKLALEEATKNHNKKPRLTPVPDLYKKQKFAKLSRSDVAVLSTINSKRNRSNLQTDEIIDSDSFGYEGERKYELHLKIERDAKLRKKKLLEFQTENGGIYCELCSFNFLDKYNFLTKNIIEVHHILPLRDLKHGVKTKLTDLMLLCSNCHFAIHQGDAEENLIIAMEQFES